MTNPTCALDGCGSSLAGLRSTARYCSAKCRDRANYLRNGATMRAASRARHERLRDDPAYKAQRAESTRRWAAENASRRVGNASARYMRDKERILAVAAAWKRANPDKLSVYGKVRRSRQRSVARVKYNPAQFNARMSYFSNKCWMCGSDADSLDHVKPISKGGPHMLSNLRPACVSCNSSKRNTWRGPIWAETLKHAS